MMQPNSPLFRSGVQPRRLWDEARIIEGERRQWQVFRWENRLVCHEDSSESWWATLDTFADGDDERDFWQSSLDRQRIARLTAFRRGFELSNGGARLSLDARWFDILIDAENGGWARSQGESQWREFADVAPRRVNKPLALRPSIWSPRFQLGFGRRALRHLAPQLAQQTLADAPPLVRELWVRGAGARLIQLVIAAIAQGWVEPSYQSQSLLEFWNIALTKAIQPLPPTLHHLLHSLGRDPFSLPAAMLESPELTAPIRVKVNNWQLSPRFTYPPSVLWRGSDFSLRVTFSAQVDSAHQQLEAKLDLRDWLAQFFALEEVHQWIQ